MKKQFAAFIFSLIVVSTAYGQKTYFTSGGEMILSFAGIDDGSSESSTIRWAPFFNIQSMLNADMSPNFGLFTGLAVRNVGYIYDHYQEPSSGTYYKKKFRSYNLGLPVGIKIGNLDKFFIYGGYEIEFPFAYKEKTFDGGDKIEKITGWFSKRQNQFQHGFLVGIQLPYGSNIKFKYYLSEFHNQDFTDSQGNKPYAGLNSHVFYISFCSYLFKNLDFNEYQGSKVY